MRMVTPVIRQINHHAIFKIKSCLLMLLALLGLLKFDVCVVAVNETLCE